MFQKLSVQLGSHNGNDIWPADIRDRNEALLLCNNHFCAIWKSDRIRLKKTIEQVKKILKTADNYITDEKENVESYSEYE